MSDVYSFFRCLIDQDRVALFNASPDCFFFEIDPLLFPVSPPLLAGLGVGILSWSWHISPTPSHMIIWIRMV